MNIDVQGSVARCIDRCEDSVGNIFTDNIQDLTQKLLEKQRQNDCGACWTSCRGMVEPLMYGHQRWRDLWHGYQLVKKIPLTPSNSAIHPD